MWINKTVYERLNADLTETREQLADERGRFELHAIQGGEQLAKIQGEYGRERGEREVLAQANRVLTAQVQFLCARVNQLEAERAILLRHLTNVDLPMPSLRATAPRPQPADDPTDLSIFEDDERHAPAGWHPDGRVNYGETPDKQSS